MIYTLGCSFAKWHWPTWADWLTVYKHPVTNWACPGYGNQLMYWLLVDRVEQITSQDHVMIMWSEPNRITQWYEEDWVIENDVAGFFPNDKKLWFSDGEDYTGLYRTHPDRKFSQIHNIVDTFKIIYDTQQLLDGIGISYTMMFMTNPWIDTRPNYIPNFTTNWDKKNQLSEVDNKKVQSILNLSPIKKLLDRIDWGKFVGNPTIDSPESFAGLWQYYVERKELFSLAHETDFHPNILAHHDYLIEKILDQELSTSVHRPLAKKLTKDNINMQLPAWQQKDFIGSVDNPLLDQKFKLLI
jgi:hypothetical protein